MMINTVYNTIYIYIYNSGHTFFSMCYDFVCFSENDSTQTTEMTD